MFKCLKKLKEICKKVLLTFKKRGSPYPKKRASSKLSDIEVISIQPKNTSAYQSRKNHRAMLYKIEIAGKRQALRGIELPKTEKIAYFLPHPSS